MKTVFMLAMLFFVLMFSACSHQENKFEKDPFNLGNVSQATPEETQALILSLKQINANLNTYKGVGSLEFRNNNKSLYSRLMWVGDTPEKIRMEMLGVHGQSVLRLASDGRWIYINSLTDGKYYKRRIKENSLEKFLDIPIDLSTVANALMGRIPIPEIKYAALSINPSNDGYLLYVLEQKTGHIEKIFLNRNKTDVSLIENYDAKGFLLYRIKFADKKEITSHRIPFSISITNGEDAGLDINVSRYWADIDVNPSVFVLLHPQ